MLYFSILVFVLFHSPTFLINVKSIFWPAMPKILVLTMSGSPEKMKFGSKDNERVPRRKLCSKVIKVTAAALSDQLWKGLYVAGYIDRVPYFH